MFVPVDKTKSNFKDYVLLYPAVSVGNVAQLSADLFISTLTMHKAGYIQHPSIVPLVGGDPFAHPESTSCKLVSCCEVYESLEHNLVIIQQRSPFIRGKRKFFKEWLVQWIKENQFRRVVIATSSTAEERLDSQLTGGQFRYVLSERLQEQFQEMFTDHYEWAELERRAKFPAPAVLEGKDSSSGELYLPGGGIAKSLYEDLCAESVPTAIFLMFCSEGDNITEATELTNKINRWLGLVNFHSRSIVDANQEAIVRYSQWKIPVSWKLFFGSRVNQALFH